MIDFGSTILFSRVRLRRDWMAHEVYLMYYRNGHGSFSRNGQGVGLNIVIDRDDQIIDIKREVMS